MKLSSFITFAGFVMLIAATYCPLLRPFHLVNWDVPLQQALWHSRIVGSGAGNYRCSAQPAQSGTLSGMAILSAGCVVLWVGAAQNQYLVQFYAIQFFS